MRARVRVLTDRELEVLRWVIGGARNKQIAAHLGIAEQTVKIHRGRVMKKLGLSTWTELVQGLSTRGIEHPRPLTVAPESRRTVRAPKRLRTIEPKSLYTPNFPRMA